MVLEISATPYIFTFKLWDWGRLGLDGKPRPIHLDHGVANIQWDRTTEWTRRELVNRIEPLARGDGWREERTGLHEREFIETRRHWFTKPVPHDTRGGVNVLEPRRRRGGHRRKPDRGVRAVRRPLRRDLHRARRGGRLHDPPARPVRGAGMRHRQGLREDAAVIVFDPGLDVRPRRAPMGFDYGPASLARTPN